MGAGLVGVALATRLWNFCGARDELRRAHASFRRAPRLGGDMARIVLQEGDITEASVDAIVNAANSDLRLGGGVAGAIRERGGPSIQRECDALGPIGVGEAVLTGAGELPARYVIHAAGMRLGEEASEDSVRSAVRSSFEIACAQGFQSIALPAIGAGIGGLAPRRCAEILLEEARARLQAGGSLEEVRFVLFGEPSFRVFESVDDAARVAAQMQRMKAR